MTTVGFLHPGAMGASLAGECSGTRLWVGAGRSAATRDRAAGAGMEEVGSLDELITRADVVVSVCPPGAAIDVAASVADAGFGGLYVDVNAIAPGTARSIADRFERFVDGGIIGPPLGTDHSPRLYLAGEEAATVAELWSGSNLDVLLMDGGAGAASAVKVCFATWTKVNASLLLAVRALAAAEGVEEALLDEWSKSFPTLAEQAELSAFGTAPKAWRFVGEMHEIGEAFAAQDLPDGFARAAAEIYERLGSFKNSPGPEFEPVLEALLRKSDT